MSSTLRDVAQLAGVSVRTVSNVITGHPHISQATRSRVEAAAAELGYRPNVLARALRTWASDPLALYLPQTSDMGHQEALGALLGMAENAGLQTAPPLEAVAPMPVCLLLRPRLPPIRPAAPAPSVVP